MPTLRGWEEVSSVDIKGISQPRIYRTRSCSHPRALVLPLSLVCQSSRQPRHPWRATFMRLSKATFERSAHIVNATVNSDLAVEPCRALRTQGTLTFVFNAPDMFTNIDVKMDWSFSSGPRPTLLSRFFQYTQKVFPTLQTASVS